MLLSGGHSNLIFPYKNVVLLNGFTSHRGREQPITRFDRCKQNRNFMHNSLQPHTEDWAHGPVCFLDAGLKFNYTLPRVLVDGSKSWMRSKV